MNEDGKFWFSIWTMAAVFLVAMTAIIGHRSHVEELAYIKNGYCRTLVTGSERTVWQKCEAK